MFARPLLLILTLLLAPAARAERSHRAVAASDPDAGAELIGRPAPAWTFERWVRGGPRRLEDLKGKVVLLRWWTEGCPFCRATLPALERLQKAHPELVVIGVFHPKPPRPVSDRHVLQVARRLGFTGPIALDQEWRTLERYWLDGSPGRSWTSVSFLLDQDGVIRWVHGGGEYHPSNDPRHRRCDLEYRELEQTLSGLLGRSASR